MSDISEEEIVNILTYTEQLFKNVYWIKQDLSIKQPHKEHYAAAINYVDINEKREYFLQELVNTVTNWVYSKNKGNDILRQRMKETNDISNSATFLSTLAFSKFRPGHPQGQMGELLLFNFIQFFFKAVPLLRKQKITTSIGHERFGADAIHYKKEGDNNILIVGESKCYKSDYKFKSAFETSLTSIESSFKNLDKELNLYLYDDFIEDNLSKIAKDYKNNKLENLKYELVCLVVYNENKEIKGDNEEEIKTSILNIIKKRCESLDDSTFKMVDLKILSRLNYIIFPIWELDKLLDQFMKLVGSEK